MISRKLEYGARNTAIEGAQRSWAENLCNTRVYIGVELVADRESLVAATQLAKTVVENMKAKGILLNTNGYDNNIIKIKPPLIVGQADINSILSTFDAVFRSLEQTE